MKRVISLAACLCFAACSPATKQADNDAVAGVGADEAAPMPTESGDGAAMATPAKVPGAQYFYCDEQADGRHYFYVDPENLDRGVVGFEFSEVYQQAHPDETAPISSMQTAISGSGMRFTNERMEFHGKGDSGMLTLSDGTVLNCRHEASE